MQGHAKLRVMDTKLFRQRVKTAMAQRDWSQADLAEAAKGKPPDAPLCPAEDGNAWTYSMVKKAFAHTLQGLTLPRFTPHSIRHGRAYWDLIEGRDIYAVKTKLDHASVKTTERYVRAAEILKRQERGKVAHRRPVKFAPLLSIICYGCPTMFVLNIYGAPAVIEA